MLHPVLKLVLGQERSQSAQLPPPVLPASCEGSASASVPSQTQAGPAQSTGPSIVWEPITHNCFHCPFFLVLIVVGITAGTTEHHSISCDDPHLTTENIEALSVHMPVEVGASSCPFSFHHSVVESGSQIHLSGLFKLLRSRPFFFILFFLQLDTPPAPVYTPPGSSTELTLTVKLVPFLCSERQP